VGSGRGDCVAVGRAARRHERRARYPNRHRPRDETAEHDGLIARLGEHETTMRAAAKARLVDDLADEPEGRSDLTIPALVTP